MREATIAAGIELLSSEAVADAVLAAARADSTGQAWVCPPGRPPEPFAFHRFFRST